ncbi:unnamed protein product [Aspergillus oryzae RIB40]|uniref:DNA, SC023 n=1 Tax=Aspergillus oryzae (strain ATCC 42149 / RIB 40) TaxID=510516 RepID=Q2UH27_ASPOR|nr:unnamed protein product [Aspergillus oryzae RIB40]BAE59138.1 unnamed protein product [Aspergillus oryzae RIB40]
MASTDTQLSLKPHHHVVKIEGAREDSENHGEDLISQLKSIPSDITALRIEEDAPSDKEWAILGSHFTDIQSLELESGFNEDLNDKELPLHWPLKRCQISSACGEVTRTPHIRQGRVSHLILLLTSGIRFEGPTSSELSKAHSQAIARGEEKADFITVKEGTPEERQIQITSIPELASKWMINKYEAPKTSFPCLGGTRQTEFPLARIKRCLGRGLTVDTNTRGPVFAFWWEFTLHKNLFIHLQRYIYRRTEQTIFMVE